MPIHRFPSQGGENGVPPPEPPEPPAPPEPPEPPHWPTRSHGSHPISRVDVRSPSSTGKRRRLRALTWSMDHLAKDKDVRRSRAGDHRASPAGPAPAVEPAPLRSARGGDSGACWTFGRGGSHFSDVARPSRGSPTPRAREGWTRASIFLRAGPAAPRALLAAPATSSEVDVAATARARAGSASPRAARLRRAPSARGRARPADRGRRRGPSRDSHPGAQRRRPRDPRAQPRPRGCP